jgi:hypothetical protein
VITTWKLKAATINLETINDDFWDLIITFDSETLQMGFSGDPQAIAIFNAYDFATYQLTGYVQADTSEEIYGALQALQKIPNDQGAWVSLACDRDIRSLELKYDESKLPVGAKV